MKKFFAALLALLAFSFASAQPAQAQMFRQAMADNVYEQNIPNFRQIGVMGPTGTDVNLDVVAEIAYEMATRDGSLTTLPEDFRREDNYKTKWRTVNGLTNRTMPFDQFRSIVNSEGLRLLRPTDFDVAAPAPIATAAPAAAATPAPVASPAPVRSPSPADQARIRGLEQRVAAAETAAREGRVTPAQLAELQALRTELNQAKTDIGSLTTTGAALDGRVTNIEDTMATDAELTEALEGKANAEDVGISGWGWFTMILALVLSLIGVAAYGRTVRLGKRVTTVETRVEEIGDALPADIRLQPEWQQIIGDLAEDEEVGVEILVRGDSGVYEPKFTVLIKKGIDGNVYCLAGIQGHNPDNAIAAKNLEQTARKAGFKNRLSNPIGGLRSVAA